MSHTIEVRELSKSYGDKLVIDNLSFDVESGSVTGFLGPNGSGKSTTMRLIVGLDHPSHGHAHINGVNYTQLRQPLREVGALLDSEAVHPGRSAYNHLLYLAQTQSISRHRIDEVLDLVGLRDVKGERAGSFSLGMRKRLGIAAALLGDPTTFIMDEPINGLDPDGIFWMRSMMRHLASEGRTVFVSSHLMGEMAQTADNLVVIDHGKLIAQCTTKELVARSRHTSVLVRSSDSPALAERIASAGGHTGARDDGALTVRDISAQRVGELANQHHIAIYELTPEVATLEEAFMNLTHPAMTPNERSLVPLATGSAAR
ncbi:ABC transporter ATP-binding protein [Rhodococcus sp. IEGM 1318]|uniref:ABC transporter ATP-binding protein n=1 Tax=Rhodococcus sp. IEGM 1318 TaxID=3082226 RepID=UPI00295568AB|nr:ATP-binding cassette domain-containing protein [Rhodococcus sp. IEGM 1318]MDV8009125.1 ATP-binding cassette domain-containing protein [Rhodococcus sp. IEGM 1318]